MASCEIDSCLRLIDVLVPEGGYLSIPLEVYFDESGSHDGAHALCVAGFMFERAKAIAFAIEWRGWLGFYGLPYFRMSECAHGNGPFKKLGKKNCIRLEKKLIGVINRYAEAGFAISLVEKDYGGIMKQLNPIKGGPYSFAAFSCLGSL